jgi:glycosyltransferase involved in cell wall biosynthesis
MTRVAPIRRRDPGALPSVCVALPVRDGAAFLTQAIDSVLRQEGVELQVRILDNGSQDESLPLARSYAAVDPRITVGVNPFDLTYYGSLNRALAETDAEYFVPFASDDVMYPDNLRRKVAALKETGAALAGSSADMVAQDGSPLGRLCPDHRATPWLVPAPDFFRRIVPENAIACQAAVVRTEALRAIGGFDVRSYYAADWLAWMRLALRHPVVTLPEALIANRVHARTITQTGSAAGANARDVPATLDHVFDDELMPAEWDGLRATVVAASHCLMATAMQDAGNLRVAQGWAAYMAMLRALARTPDDPAIRDELNRQVLAAGLHPIELPGDAAAQAPLVAADAEALGAAVRELGPLVGRLVLQVDADAADAAMAVLEPVFAGIDLDVVLAPATTEAELLLPGRLVLAAWGSEFVAVAEAAGVPVYAYNLPDPFAVPPDPERWQTLDLDACLV